MCLTSNLQTGAVRNIGEHPLGSYFRQGLRVTVNTDNRLMSDTTVTDEILLAARAFRLSPYEIKRLVINGFKSSFLPYADKARRLREVNLEIDRIFMEEYPDDYDRRLTSF
jgi:adenosine deaminase